MIAVRSRSAPPGPARSESQGLIVLREALARILGWSPSLREAVDLALRQVCRHVVQRSVLIVSASADFD
jgi:hypothetical protein